MMTSASACSSYSAQVPSPVPTSISTSLEDLVGDDMSMATSASASTSLRLAKRQLPFSNSVDSCKKRRKQSTPIRISTNSNVETADDTANCVNLGIGLCCEGKMGSSPFLPQSPLEQDRENSSLAVPLPDEPLLTHANVKLELSPGHDTTSPDSVPVNLSGGQNLPPWLSDISNKSNDWLNASILPGNSGNNSITATSMSNSISNHNPFYVPVPVTTGVNASQPFRSTNQPPIRIFNPEAYCELCNKEFCNKYFLKTHKANKHRIYTDPPTSDIVSLSVNVPTFTASSSGIKKSTASNIAIADVPPLKTLDLFNKVNLNTIVTPHSDFSVYCDICGKNFANKALLKSHRTNIHGISSEQDHSTDAVDIERALSFSVQKEERDIDLNETPGVGDNESITYKNEQLKDEIANFSTLDQDENSENATLNEHLNQQQKDKESLDFSVNRSRRLGIMNPEAFCEICCKEYCNKYFLRTHKMKRHGIIIPDDNSKDNSKDFKIESSTSNNWYQIQTSPLNLIMGEQNTNSSGSYSERKSSPPNENECEICGMRFQTSYLAQLHFATAHSQTKQMCNNDDFSNVFPANNNEKQASDTISEDLQKLQTMILQLNDLDVSKVGTNISGSSLLCTCSICGKDFDNKYYLHAHLMTEHGVLLENNTNISEKQYESDNVNDNSPDLLSQNNDNQIKPTSTSTPLSTNITTISHSGTSLDKKEDLNGINLDKTIRNASTNNTNNSNSSNLMGVERRSSVSLTPTNSYCEICNKELCNKYFMKTHMQRMHGIEIENGAQIGGVVCNICNKELCSKYFLRVHKHNTHGIVQDNVGVVNTNQPRQLSAEIDQQISTEMSSGGITTAESPIKLGDITDLSNRYFTHFTEVCSLCSRRFRSTKWLKAHLLSDHGKAGSEKWNELELQLQQSFGQQQQQRKNFNSTDCSSPTLRIPNGGQDNVKTESGMQNVLSSIFGTDELNVKQYHCSFCSFSTPVLAFLFVHERSHSHAISIGETITSGSGIMSNNSSSTGNNNTNNCSTSMLYCTICNQSFRQPAQYHHHMVSQHSFLSLNSFINNIRQSQGQSIVDTQLDSKTEISPLETTPETSTTKAAVTLTTTARIAMDQSLNHHQCSKCSQCGQIQKDIEISPTILNSDVTITLKDVSKQRQLPATYALPQHQLNAKYMMQAFLMDEPSSDAMNVGTSASTGATITTAANVLTKVNVAGTEITGPTVPISSSETGDDERQQHKQLDNNEHGNGNNSTTSDRRFAPSIVFLPVLEKLTAPLTVSFTLTPA